VTAVIVAALSPMPSAVGTGDLSTYPVASIRAEPITEHLLVISIDGLRPDAIEQFGPTEILRLMHAGRYSLSAETVLPSNTVPGHTSMVTGVEPRVHGVTWNDRASVLSALALLSDRRRKVPTMFQFARAFGYSTAAIVGKSQLRQLDAPGSLDHLRAPFLPIAHFKREWSVARVAAEVEAYLIAGGARPNLLFVHLAEPDVTGHDHGWMSDRYGRAVLEADRALQRILSAADVAFGDEGYTVILTSDHGGLGDGHGGADPREITIPWIAAGRGVEPAGELEVPVRVEDTAATVLWLLGVPVPTLWTGRPVGSDP
jgi:predicted AlkP superfamily pyrophosphatase or phosphodiesterase